MAEIQDPVTGTTRFDDDDVNRRTGSFGRQPDSAELRREIDRTRAQMDETFDMLEQKLTPGQLMGEVWNLFRGGSTAGASKLWQVAKEHPMPAAVIGLGVGWLLLDSGKDKTSSSTRFQRYRGGDSDFRGYGAGQEYSRYGNSYSGGYSGSYYNNTENRSAGTYGEDSEHEGRLSSAAHRAKDAVGDIAESAKDTLGHAADSAKETLHDARERVGDLTDRARHQASHLTDRARHQATSLKGQARHRASQARTGFWDKLEEQPLMVGAATLALGLLAGLSIPSTRKEDELMGETRDRLFDEVKDAGREALDKGKQVANAAVETIKQEAENSDLTAAGLAEKVRTVAKEATNTVKEEAKKQNLVPGQSDQQGSDMGTAGKAGRGKPATAGTPGASFGAAPTQTSGLPGTEVKGQTDKVHSEEPELVKR